MKQAEDEDSMDGPYCWCVERASQCTKEEDLGRSLKVRYCFSRKWRGKCSNILIYGGATPKCSSNWIYGGGARAAGTLDVEEKGENSGDKCEFIWEWSILKTM